MLAFLLWVTPAAPLPLHPAPLVLAQSQEETSAEETVDAILDEFEARQREFFEAYQAAEDDAARQRLFEERYPKASDYIPRLWKAIDAHPGGEASARALAWIAQVDEQGPDRERAVARLLADHPQSEVLQDVCSTLEGDMRGGRAVLAAILEKSPHRSVKANALFSLAGWYMRSADLRRSLDRADEQTRKALVEFHGPETVAYLEAHSEKELVAEAERLLEQVVAEYGDIEHWRGTLGDAAKGALFEIRHLQIGMIAPDIEGEDIDGVPFKLSDYRGKVVVLDFWGDW